jgi:hypothetical protein
MDLKDERYIKLSVLNFPEWKKESTCYIFSVRARGMTPETPAKWEIDTWYKVDYSKPEEAQQSVGAIKLRARFNNAFVYGVWLPNELAKDIDAKNNPEDYYELIMKYKFPV